LQAAGLGNGRDLALTPNGVLFADGNLDSTNIYRMPFDAAFRKASGDPVPLIVGAGFSFSPVASQDGLRMAFTVGNNLSVNIWRVPLDAGIGKASGEPVRVTSGLEPSLAPSPSRDGKHVVYIGGTLRAREIRIRDLTTGKDLRLADARDWSYAVLSQDGSTIAFSSDQRENSPLYSIPASGGPRRKSARRAAGRSTGW
jgi:Tol biopolymer transport system component